MQNILIYSTKTCPNCKILKELLTRDNLFKEVNMAIPDAMTEIMHSVFTMSAPVYR